MPSADRPDDMRGSAYFPDRPEKRTISGTPLRDGRADVSGNIFPFRPPLSAAFRHTLGSSRVGIAEQPPFLTGSPGRQSLPSAGAIRTRVPWPRETEEAPTVAPETIGTTTAYLHESLSPPRTIFRRSAPKPHCPKKAGIRMFGKRILVQPITRPAWKLFIFLSRSAESPEESAYFCKTFPYVARTPPKVPERG